MKSLITLFLCVSIISCRDKHPMMIVRKTGTIHHQGITTYQYGSHILIDNDGNLVYALRSNNVNLDNFVGDEVEIWGAFVEGYPVEDGPDFVDVTEVK